MTTYQNMPPAGSPPGYQPPVVPRPLQNPAYAQEKKCLRQSANCFGVAAIFDSTVLSVYRAAVVWQFGGCVLFVEYRRLCPVFFRRLWGIPAFFEDAVAGCGPIKTGAGRNRIVEHSRNICSFGDRVNFDLPFFSAVFCNRLSTGDQ